MKKQLITLLLLLTASVTFAQYRISTEGESKTFYIKNLTNASDYGEPYQREYVVAKRVSSTNIEIQVKGVTYNERLLTKNGGLNYSEFRDGNNSDATFASADAVLTWFKENTGFKTASGGSGASAFSELTGNIADGQVPESAVTQYKEALGIRVSVKDFGALGDGTTNDLAAFDAATASLTTTGGTLFIPNGYYRLTGTWNIGLPQYDNFDFMVDRTAPVLDADFDANDIPANKITNRDNYESIDIVFDKGAFIVADWTPTLVEPVLSYNLKTDRDKGGKGKIINPQIIGTSVFVGGVQNNIAIGTPVTNNLIGIFYDNKVGLVENAYISALGYGIVQANPYWSTLENVTIHWAKEAINTLQGNAYNANNLEIWNSTKGLIFNGEASTVSNLNTQQVANELWVMKADVCNFIGGYFEDVSITDGTGDYFVKLGTTEDSTEITHSTFQGFRTGAARPNKVGMKMWSSKKNTFESFRLLSKGFVVDDSSTGTMINTDVDFGDNFRDNYDSEITEINNILVNSVLGPELIGDQGMDDNAWWTKEGVSIADGVGIFDGDGSGAIRFKRSKVNKVGKTYRLQFDVINTNGYDLGDVNGSIKYGTQTVGTKVVYYTASYVDLSIKAYTGGGAVDVTIDNVSLKEVLSPKVKNIESNTANYTATFADDIITMDATGGNRTVTLPTASTVKGQSFFVKKIDVSANTVTVVGTIDGVTNKVLSTQYQSVTVISNGTDYYIVD